MVELLPCPFCGGTEIENTWDDYWSLMQRCVTCGAQGGVVEDNDPNCKTEVEKRAKAIELWNRRAPTLFGLPIVEVDEDLGDASQIVFGPPMI